MLLRVGISMDDYDVACMLIMIFVGALVFLLLVLAAVLSPKVGTPQEEDDTPEGAKADWWE
jgi:hypothetical protein